MMLFINLPPLLASPLGNRIKGLISFCVIPSKVAMASRVGIMRKQNRVRLCKKNFVMQPCLIVGHNGSLLVLLVFDKDEKVVF
jgi:hypothetical protein